MSRRKTLIIVGFVLSFLALNSQSNCQLYRTGKFVLKDPNLKINNKIERTETYQLEKDLQTGAVTMFTINWLSECEYELTIMDGDSEQVNFFRGKKLIVKILEVYSDGYKFEGHIKGTNIFKTHLMQVSTD